MASSAMSHAAFLPAAAAAAAAAAAGKSHLWSSDKEILVSHVVGPVVHFWFESFFCTIAEDLSFCELQLLTKTHP